MAGKKFDRVFGIAGGGDFIFNLMALGSVGEGHICDIRPMAPLTVDLKRALFKSFGFEELLKLFTKDKGGQANEVYNNIRDELAPESREVLFSPLYKGDRGGSFLHWLKRKRLWYTESWRAIKKRDQYLAYLSGQRSYEQMRRQLGSLNIYYGDFMQVLRQVTGSFNLIYTSNIFDSKKYWQRNLADLQLLVKKLSPSGQLLVTTQHHPRKVRKLIEPQGLRLVQHEPCRTNFLTTLRREYAYSFMLFRKSL